MIKRIATAVVLIPLVLLLVLKAPLYVLAIVAGAVALLAIAEFLKLVTHYAVQPLTLATYAFVALFFAYVIVASTNRTPLIETTAVLYGLAMAAALAPFVFLSVAMRRSDLTSGYPAAAASAFAFGYIAIPMALLVEIRQQPAGAIWTIYTLLAVWAGDMFAYFVGRVVFFFAVYGQFDLDIHGFLGMLALGISLNGGVAKPVVAPQPKVVFNRFKLNPSVRRPAGA